MLTIEEQLRQVAALREAHESASAAAEDAKAAYQRARLELWERMDATDITSVGIDGTTFTRKSTIYGSVSDKAEFIKWAEDNAPELVEPHPRKALVNELVRQKIDNGEELPPGLNFYVDRYVSQTKQ